MMSVTHPNQLTEAADAPRRLPFPPLTRSHVLHCSYHYWHPKYRAITPKARLIPLSDPFVSYLRSDGIVLPPETPNNRAALADDDSGVYSFSGASDDDDGYNEDDDENDPSVDWRDIHNQIRDTIDELGGKVTPKLNWSAPKDATWISATNDLQCQSASDIYLLLKSSDFVTHDLEHAFDDCEPEPGPATTETIRAATSTITPTSSTSTSSTSQIPYHLVLRKYFNLNPSLEFRCFVRNRSLLCICQRDLNHFDFLFQLRRSLRVSIQTFFDKKLKDTFPDPDFVFDVYIPPPHDKVWLIDINPFAIRTDPLLFSWLEILEMETPNNRASTKGGELDVVRVPIFSSHPSGVAEHAADGLDPHETDQLRSNKRMEPDREGAEEDEEEEGVEDIEDADSQLPEFRLVGRDDPEAYGFTTPQYSAHKLPREVVDASRSGPGGLQEFMGQWQEILAKRFQEEQELGSSDDE